MQISPYTRAGPGPDRPKKNLNAQQDYGKEQRSTKNKTSQGTNLKSNINPEPWARTRRKRNPVGKEQEMNMLEKTQPITAPQIGRKRDKKKEDERNAPNTKGQEKRKNSKTAKL